MVFFDWNDLFEPLLPSFLPFQIRVKFNSKNIYRCIVDEGASASILSSSSWQALSSLELVSTSHELLVFERHHSEYLGILLQFHLSLGGNIFLFNVIVVQGPLDFNILIGHDYVYVMNSLVSTLFWVMHFHNNRIIIIIDEMECDNHHPNLALVKVSLLYVTSVHVDSSPPQINYVAYYPRCSIPSEQKPM
jgi:hypothetical protein